MVQENGSYSRWGESKRPQTEKEVPFVRRAMVDWLSPAQLARTGVKVALAGLFGSYFDKRELQGAIAAESPDVSPVTQDYTLESDGRVNNELWFDYVADLGDGFNATYAVAWMLAAPQLKVGGALLPRGRFLLMGGDQVYPTANQEDYQDRLEGPYRAALPYAHIDPPHLYAIPGNHDWYDGLTGFLRLFCQSPRHRWIGGWLTRQRRSYFALKLPHGWWVWGADLQTGDIDKPQLNYFERVAEMMSREQTESKEPQNAIIITAEPAWIYCGATKDCERLSRGLIQEKRFRSLNYFENILRDRNLRVAVVLSGDLHHYCRYQESGAERPTQRITNGGGGAFLYATHHMPKELDVPEGHLGNEVRYRLQEPRYPSAEDSKRKTWGVMLLPVRNWWFAVILAALYTLFAWTFQSASINNNKFTALKDCAGAGVMSLAALAHPCYEWSEFPWWLGRSLAHSPASVVLAVAVVFLLWQFSKREGKSYRITQWSGIVHGFLHIALAVGLFWFFAWFDQAVWPGLPVEGVYYALVFTAAMLFFGWLFGGLLFAGYLLVISRICGAHLNEVFSSQAIQDCKSFLRFHVDQSGTLEIYPIKLDRTPKDWELDKDGSPSDARNAAQHGTAPPWFRPVGVIPQPELIEPPIIVRR